MSIRQLARDLEIPFSTLMYRIKAGWDEKDWGLKKPKPPAGYQICCVCKKAKIFSNFYKRYGRNGYISRCKECAKKTTPKGG